jgi:hypothetical protein
MMQLLRRCFKIVNLLLSKIKVISNAYVFIELDLLCRDFNVSIRGDYMLTSGTAEKAWPFAALGQYLGKFRELIFAAILCGCRSSSEKASET